MLIKPFSVQIEKFKHWQVAEKQSYFSELS